MKMNMLAVAAVGGLSFGIANAAIPQIFEINGATPGDIEDTVNDFRDALGPNNGNAPVNGNRFGRRQIDWDAAPDGVSDPNLFPGDFFNADVAPRARGIEFRATGTTDSFQLSSTAASGEPVRFGLPGQFTAFSEERLFTPVNGNTFDVVFFDPSNQTTQATTRGLGIVFTDVEFDVTTMTFFDVNDEEIFARTVLSGPSASLSFLGVVFDSFEVARVSVSVGQGFFDGTNFPVDGVVMDDFIFGEPVAVPVPGAALLFAAPLLALARRKRSA